MFTVFIPNKKLSAGQCRRGGGVGGQVALATFFFASQCTKHSGLQFFLYFFYAINTCVTAWKEKMKSGVRRPPEGSISMNNQMFDDLDCFAKIIFCKVTKVT
ncbi:hypothetical protein CHARACLAT_031980 [Characodon lateralis]|uniref:Uncharacterized protein n=1 Tax=Characodon lateralis TaxID=208331 RepID=A0ABU7DBS3_9TELE|nr:hypothetical protein [Characodon lateralis]